VREMGGEGVGVGEDLHGGGRGSRIKHGSDDQF
jgi:hypothetical protein